MSGRKNLKMPTKNVKMPTKNAYNVLLRSKGNSQDLAMNFISKLYYSQVFVYIAVWEHLPHSPAHVHNNYFIVLQALWFTTTGALPSYHNMKQLVVFSARN